MQPHPASTFRRLGLVAALAAVAALVFANTAFAHPAPAENSPAVAGAKVRAYLRPKAQPQGAVPAGVLEAPIRPAAEAGLDAFIASVADGSAGVLRGVYVPGVLALRVIQQPASAPFYVDLTPGVATQYGAASAYGVTGLLADNIASGVDYYGLAPGHEVSLVYGDGSVRRYVVSGVYRFQALNPSSPYSEFLNLDSGDRLSATALFSQMYSGGDHVTFQTCLAQDGLMTWGRLFVTAVPAD